LKEKFTIEAKIGDLVEVHMNEDKSGYDFKILKEETNETKQRLLDLIEGMKKE